MMWGIAFFLVLLDRSYAIDQRLHFKLCLAVAASSIRFLA
jgi:hypothetical protein